MLPFSDHSLQERWHRRRSLVLPHARRPARRVAPSTAPLAQACAIGPALAWEQLQEEATRAFLAGDGVLPARNWARAQELAETSFAQSDPRLAASLTNQGHALLQSNRQHQALRLFARAADGWEQGWRWVRRMTPPNGAPAYDEDARVRFMQLLRLGQQASAAVARMEPLALNGLAHFETVRPRRMNDLRALLAAVFLMVPCQADRG